MVRKKDRKKADLKREATFSFINVIGVECFLLEKDDDYFALNKELNQWIRIPKWAYKKYKTEHQKNPQHLQATGITQ
ncbi:hypothetical protein R4467_02070 [Acinetobacter baumannii]|nr:hypothetical protein [Acinetobacter baumannii]